jgi:hypothetical protein
MSKMIPPLRNDDRYWEGEGPTREAAEADALRAYDEWAAERRTDYGPDAERAGGVLPADLEAWDVFHRIERRVVSNVGRAIVVHVAYLRAVR